MPARVVGRHFSAVPKQGGPSGLAVRCCLENTSAEPRLLASDSLASWAFAPSDPGVIRETRMNVSSDEVLQEMMREVCSREVLSDSHFTLILGNIKKGPK